MGHDHGTVFIFFFFLNIDNMIWDNEEHIPLYHMIPTLHLTKT